MNTILLIVLLMVIFNNGVAMWKSLGRPTQSVWKSLGRPTQSVWKSLGRPTQSVWKGGL